MNMRISGLISIVILTIGVFNKLYSQSEEAHVYSKEELEKIIFNELTVETSSMIASEVKVIYQYDLPHNGATIAYFQQYYRGIEVYKAIGNIVVTDNNVFIKSERIVKEADLFNHHIYKLDPVASVVKVAEYLNLPLRNSKGELIRRKDNIYELTRLPYASGNVLIRQVWAKNLQGVYESSWAIELKPSVNSDHWEICVDAANGSVLSSVNNTVYCTFEQNPGCDQNKNYQESRQSTVIKLSDNKNKVERNDGAQYRVFAPPLESPQIGERSLIMDPADEEASPFGWHDINGVEGADFDILRGNNVHAYQDTMDSNVPGGHEPKAESELIFDFPFGQEASPLSNLNADLTNLFFWNNYIHDWSYAFGFNEAAGNFQQNNYFKGGRDKDYIFAETLDGSDVNNANFSGPRDGTNGRMQMYKWVVGNDFEILSPQNISGLYNTGTAGFGRTLIEPIIESIVLVTDIAGNNRDACEDIVNVEELSGKIAMIDRGTCDFSFKVYAAQEAGAIACLICNNLDNAPLVTMAAGANADLVNIPSLFLSKEDCALIKSNLEDVVTGRFNETRELSSGFDNGIVVHEYAHGISMRLAGGPNTSGCLSNDEQMGEGLSDFIALVLTQLPSDEGISPRGIGTYVSGVPRNNRGIRRYPYSTDFSINPQVHSHIRASTRPHDVGEIWADVLWDMYWAFIEEEGYDPTWKNRESGNFKAIQTVIDALKIQECDPSLIEARDAILQADQLNYSGEHECLIWTVFARRGLGEDAFAGNSDDRYDNIDGFRTPLKCNGEFTLSKNMTPTISPGDEIEVILKIENHRESISEILVTDQIPEGTVVTSSSLKDNVAIEGNTINFNVGTIGEGEIREMKYFLSTNDIQHATFDIYDEMEGAIQFDRSVSNPELKGWSLTTSQSASGIFSLRVTTDTLGGESYAVRKGTIKVSPQNRLLRFEHQYGTQLGIDGGTIEISRDQGENWEPIGPERYLVNPIKEQITFDFLYRNTLPAFTGSRGWHSTIIDLEDYMNEEITLRFRYVSLRFREPVGGIGWFIDDFQLYQRKELAGEACAKSLGNTIGCSSDFTLVNSNAGDVPVTEILTDQFFLGISPNPASDYVDVLLNSKDAFSGTMRIINIEGKEVYKKPLKVYSGENAWKEDISQLMPGMYFLELSQTKDRFTVAFIKQ